MFRVGLAIAAAALIAGAASAQPAGPAPDPEKLSLARQIMAANGGVEGTQAQLKTMFENIRKLAQASMGTAPPAQAQAIADTLMKNMQDEELKAVPALIDGMAEVYATQLTAQELKDMLAWSKSPSAQSIRLKMPAVTSEMMQRQAPLVRKMTSAALTTAMDKTCEQTHCTADQRQALAAIVARFAPAS